MCIIVVKPWNVDYPKKETLKRCFDNNDNGAGFGYVKKGEKKVTIKKGFMSFNDFWKAYSSTIQDVKYEDIQLVCHFRITTSGGTSKENCHPFPISDDKKELTAQHIESDIICAMNGVVDCINTDKSLSDTMEIIKREFSQFKKLNKGFYKHNTFGSYIDNEVGAKWAFMDPKNIYLYGDFKENDGLYFSNDTYKYSRWYSYRNVGYLCEKSYKKNLLKNIKKVKSKKSLDDLYPYYGYIVKDKEFKYASTNDSLYTDQFDRLYYVDGKNTVYELPDIDVCYDAYF